MEEENRTLVTLEQVALVCTDKVVYSPYGYVIAKDGTLYALIEQYTHGVVIALLEPEAAKKWCAGEKDERSPVDYAEVMDSEYFGVYAMQRFGLDCNGELGYVTINRSMLVGFSVGKGREAATPEQLAAVRRVLNNEGLKDADEVYSDFAEVSVKKLMANLARHNDDCTYQGEDDECPAAPTES